MGSVHSGTPSLIFSHNRSCRKYMSILIVTSTTPMPSDRVSLLVKRYTTSIVVHVASTRHVTVFSIVRVFDSVISPSPFYMKTKEKLFRNRETYPRLPVLGILFSTAVPRTRPLAAGCECRILHRICSCRSIFPHVRCRLSRSSCRVRTPKTGTLWRRAG